jgi:hypothetical protein
MTDSALSTPKRLLRVLLGGAILATAWVAIDLIAHSDNASAVEFPDSTVADVAPSGSHNPASEVITPLIARVTSIAAHVSTGPASSVAHGEAAVGNAVSVILSAPLAVISPVVEALAEPLAPVVWDVVGPLPAIPQLPGLWIAGVLLSNAGTGVAIATSNVPLSPTPVGGVPRDPPAVPTPSSGDQLGLTTAVLNSAFLAPPGSASASRAVAGGIPPSPTYGFDTTPD